MQMNGQDNVLEAKGPHPAPLSPSSSSYPIYPILLMSLSVQCRSKRTDFVMTWDLHDKVWKVLGTLLGSGKCSVRANFYVYWTRPVKWPDQTTISGKPVKTILSMERRKHLLVGHWSGGGGKRKGPRLGCITGTGRWGGQRHHHHPAGPAAFSTFLQVHTTPFTQPHPTPRWDV